MNVNRLGRWTRARRMVIALVAATLVLCGMTAGRASADTQTFGSDLTSVPTLDTANGAYSNTGSTAGSGPTVVSPNPHVASDTSIWNVSGPSGATAPQGGQVIDVKIEGCAREDNSAPEQLSQGYPVNGIGFQTLTNSGGGYTVGVDSTTDGNGNPFTLPFCSNSSDPTSGAVNTSTVTTFQPIHMCIAAGSLVDFHDIGGFIPRTTDGKGPWYPQGVPFIVIGRDGSSTIDTFVGGDAPPGTVYSSSASSPGAGAGSTAGMELELQVVLATGGDAYGLCPGGTANESATSNTVICDYGTPTNGHEACDRNGNPVSGTSTGTSTGTGTGTGTGSGTGTKTGTGGVKTAAPKLSTLLLNHKSLSPKTGLTVSYSDTVTGTTTLRVTQEQFGRKSGRKCVTTPEKKLAHNLVCRFFATVATVHHVDAIGRNSLVLNTKKFTRGTYQLKLVSTFGTHTSRTLVESFKVT